MRFNLLQEIGVHVGGEVSFIAHLARSLQAMGHEAHVFRIAPKSDPTVRPHLDGITRLKLSYADAMQLPGISIVCAYRRSQTDLLDGLNAKGDPWGFVLHDPLGINQPTVEALQRSKECRVLCVRKAGVVVAREYGLDARWLPHPYLPGSPPRKTKYERKPAASLCRVSNNKNIHLILNAIKFHGADIDLWGSARRRYRRGFLTKRYGAEFLDKHLKGAHPRQHFSGQVLACQYNWIVDMTMIPNDGGGTQYTFFEAWHAGCGLILHPDWFQKEGDVIPGHHCDLAGTPEEIAEAIQKPVDSKQVAAGRLLTRRHGPERVVPLLLSSLRLEV